jgi:long-chain fatty acid transport protein
MALAGSKKWLLFGTTICTSLSLGAIAAQAAGYGIAEQSTASVAEATAGDTTDSGAAFSYYNPAGMTLIAGSEVEGDLTFFDLHSTVNSTLKPGADPNAPVVYAPDASQSGHASGLLESTLIPTGFAVLGLPRGLKLGFDIVSPDGGRMKYPTNFIGDQEGGEALLTEIQGGLSLAIPITERLSIGGGPVLDYFQNKLTDRQNLPGEAETPDGYGAIGAFQGQDYRFGFNAGLLYRPTDSTRIGIDYRSKITHDVKGVDSLDVGALQAELAQIHLVVPPASAAEDKFVMPQTINFGIYQQVTRRLAVMANAQWENWHAVQSLIVNDPTLAQIPDGIGPEISPIYGNLHFRDAWTIGVGAKYQATAKLTLMGGAAYDETPVTSAAYRTTLLPDSNRVMIGIGEQYQVLPNLILQAAYAHYFVASSGIDQTRTQIDGASTGSGTLQGTYQESADVFSTGIVGKF